MHISRRSFLQLSTAAGVGAVGATQLSSRQAASSVPRAAGSWCGSSMGGQ
ncbi:MAG: twin-arginine translocation signal domain-containing protein [candidate division NC10 bacterium]|nr:twin-arginine translocation signal domain-containing protein [candidate division NC10 bacterium]